MKIKIIRIGNSRGVILSTAVLKKFNLSEGDNLFLSQTENPQQIILRPAETEAEFSGISRKERRDIENFLDMYTHLFKGL